MPPCFTHNGHELIYQKKAGFVKPLHGKIQKSFSEAGALLGAVFISHHKTGQNRHGPAVKRDSKARLRRQGQFPVSKGLFSPKYYVNMFTYIFLRGGITADGQTQEGIV